MNKSVYIIFAMKRSGHHAFANWLCRQHNNIVHVDNAADRWENKELKSVWNRQSTYGDGSKAIVYSIEDFDIKDWSKYKMYDFPVLKNADNIYPIILLRDFKNWIASCLKRREATGDARDVYEMLNSPGYNDRKDFKPSRIELFKQQLEECVSPSIIKNLIPVKYNEWVCSKDYRKDIAKKLNINFTDEGILEVAKAGGGSTFDGYNYQHKANQMNVLERWKVFKDDEENSALLEQHKEVLKKSNEFFNI